MCKILKIIEVVLIIVVLGCTFLFLGYSETHYKREGFINSTNTVDIVDSECVYEYIFTDYKGNQFVFLDDEIIIDGQKAMVRMFNNCTTDYIEDDIVLDYQFLNN